MNDLNLRNDWLLEEKESFKGWDFSHLDGRWETEKLPWNYKDLVIRYLKPEHQLLDMGTGGGEFLLTLGHPYGNTSVTEGWEPNVVLCKERLEPIGICVKQMYDDSSLPFANNTFDIIINRHDSYDVEEIKRVLKPKGLFITQQVGGKNNEQLSNGLIPNFKPQFPDLSLQNENENFERCNFNILYANEYFPSLRFYDTGAVVFFAKIIEWEFPNFSVDACYDKLCRLQDELEEKGFIQSFEHRFILVAQNIKLEVF